MRYSSLSALSLATTLLACAHSPANHHAASEGTAEERAEMQSARNQQRAENAMVQDENQRVEPVEVPQRRGDPDRVASRDATLPVQTNGPQPNAGIAADNTGINERDRDNAHVTPMDQGNGAADVDLTQRIRKAVMADDSLSFSAKNAKIITRDGRVTLRGAVKNAAEKDAIYKCAVSAAGVGRVANELEVDSK